MIDLNPHIAQPCPDVDPRIEFIGRYGVVDAYIVDGWKVRNDIFIDFVEGGNDAAYPWMPPRTIWIDDANAPEMKFVLLHELYERRVMEEEGVAYDQAHDAANKIELEARHTPDEVDRLIAEEANRMKKALTFNEVLKDAGVGDVHVPAAGGDGGKKRKRRKVPRKATFNQITSTMGEVGDADADMEKGWEFTVEKVDADQRLVFGWASIAQVGGRDVVDKQEDTIPLDELEKASYEFCLNYREQDDMHTGDPTGRCVECMVFTPEKAAKGLVAKNAAGEQVYGMWVGFHVDDDALWKAHKEGKRPQFSIGGSARKEVK